MDEGARFPTVPAGSGHYESFYIKACRPGGGLGIWIRHTVHKRPGAEPKGSLWFTLFEAGAGPRATKVTVPSTELSAPAGSWIRVADAEIGPGRAAGSVSTGSLSATWSLSFSGDADPCKYLPADWLYEAPLPRTKFVAPFPDARFEGTLEVDGATIALEAWPGMIGHNWGSEHAERWVWLEGSGFTASPGTYFDAGAARVRVGPWTTRWIPSGMLVIGGQAHRLGGLDQMRHCRINESPHGCDFRLTGSDLVVEGRVSAPAEEFVGWVYADPKASSGTGEIADRDEHHTLNCSISDLELRVRRAGRPEELLSLPGGGAYEIGIRETDHGVPIQPHPDG